MTAPKRLLAVDLDGTLLDPRGVPHPRDVRAVRAALVEGVSVSIVTGRLYSGSRSAAEVLGLKGTVGCADGSYLVRALDHTTLVHHGLTGAHVIALKRALVHAAIATFVFARDAIGHDATGEPFVHFISPWSNDLRVAADVFEHDLWAVEEGITGVVALGNENQLALAARQLEVELGATVTIALFPLRRGPHAGMWAIMVRAAGGTKGTALRWIADHIGVALEDTVCVGDWINDLPMFDVAGRSFAMGHAPDEVKSRATDVLAETVDEGGGVAAAIAKVFGIRVD